MVVMVALVVIMVVANGFSGIRTGGIRTGGIRTGSSSFGQYFH